MVNTKFELYKLKRELLRSGIVVAFERPMLNEFKEPSGTQPLGFLRALYHEQNSYVKLTEGDAARIRTKKVPMLLCLYEDVQSVGVQVDDVWLHNGKTFKVTGVTNVQEWSLVADISLEVVDDGRS